MVASSMDALLFELGWYCVYWDKELIASRLRRSNGHQSLKTFVPFSANALTRFALGIIPCSVNDGVTGFSLAPLSAIRPQLLCGLGSLSQAST